MRAHNDPAITAGPLAADLPSGFRAELQDHEIARLRRECEHMAAVLCRAWEYLASQRDERALALAGQVRDALTRGL